jgi:hypothetical protein
MKKVSFLIVLLLLVAMPLMGATRNMKITWNANTDDATSYNIYVNNALLTNVGGITTTTWTGAVNLIEGSNTIELTALDASMNESPRSLPCFFVLDTVPPAKVLGVKAILVP